MIYLAIQASSRSNAFFNSKELVTTATELQLMIAPASAGESISPHPGRKTPAAKGIAMMLYPNAQIRFERTCVGHKQ